MHRVQFLHCADSGQRFVSVNTNFGLDHDRQKIRKWFFSYCFTWLDRHTSQRITICDVGLFIIRDRHSHSDCSFHYNHLFEANCYTTASPGSRRRGWCSVQ